LRTDELGRIALYGTARTLLFPDTPNGGWSAICASIFFLAEKTMNIRIGYEISFQTTVNLPMNLVLYTHPSREHHLFYPDLIHVQPEFGPELPVQIARDAFGNKVGRIVSPGGLLRINSEKDTRRRQTSCRRMSCNI
jgi:hypothetical protein